MTDLSHPRDRGADELPAVATSRTLADDIIDEFVPEELDWRSVVASYPKTSVVVLAAAGFWLGRSRGGAILSGVTNLVTETVNESINEFFGRDVL